MKRPIGLWTAALLAIATHSFGQDAKPEIVSAPGTSRITDAPQVSYSDSRPARTGAGIPVQRNEAGAFIERYLQLIPDEQEDEVDEVRTVSDEKTARRRLQLIPDEPFEFEPEDENTAAPTSNRRQLLPFGHELSPPERKATASEDEAIPAGHQLTTAPKEGGLTFAVQNSEDSDEPAYVADDDYQPDGLFLTALEEEAKGAGGAGCSPGGACTPKLSTCTTCWTEECCCTPAFWQHHDSLFGDFLYLSARDVDVSYATHVDGPTMSAVPVAPTLMADNEYQPGFRVGGNLALDDCTSLRGTFWSYESGTIGSGTLPGGTGFFRPELTHPNTLLTNIGDDLDTRATYDIDFQLAEIEYRTLLSGDECHAINAVFGIRYGNLDQDFLASYSINGITNVRTEIDFDGAGPRFGLTGEWAGKRGLFFYGNGFASLLVGEFRADYWQTNNLVVQQARNGIQDDRFVPQVELELGVGWENRCRNFRIRAGYLMSSWFNAITTPDFIDGVQANDLEGIHDTLNFDGFTVGAEFRF